VRAARAASPQHVEHPEDVGVEDGARLLVGRLLHRSEQPVSRIVGDDVDAAEGLDGPGDGVVDVGPPADVGGERKDPGTVLVDARAERRGIASQRDDVVAAAGRGLCERQPDPGGGAGDEPGGRGVDGHDGERPGPRGSSRL
jgi:hypothetical protein